MNELNECSGLCDCPEDDTIFLSNVLHIFGCAFPLWCWRTGAVFNSELYQY